MQRKAGLLALGLLAACYSPSIDYGNGKLQCSANHKCPSGFHCATDNTCWRNGANPDAGVGDGGPDGAGGDGGGSGALAIDRPNQDFGTVVTGQSSTPALFIITNTGSTPTGTPLIALSGANASSFMIGASTCQGALAAGGTCGVAVVFSPGASGPLAAQLGVIASPGGSVTAALTGTGVGLGALRISPATQDFGGTITGTTSSTLTFTVSNTGGTATGVLASTLTGTDTAQFAVTSAGAKSASFTVTGTPGGTAVASLAGAGLAPGALAISPGAHDFGAVVAGASSTTTVFTVTNTGSGASGALTTSLSGSGAGEFMTSADTCMGQTLAANATCTVTGKFAPTSAGAKVATLAVSGTPGGTAAASLTGMGLGQAGLAIAPPSQNYGDVVAGNSSTVTLTVSNTGGVATGMPAAALAGADMALFTVTASTCTGPIAPGGSCSITVRFTPTGAGAKAATLMVTASPGGAATATLTGNALAAGALTANPPSRDYGSVAQGGTSGTMSFSFTNSGGSATGTLTTGVTGTAMAEFMVTADTCATHPLAAAASCSVTVAFAPSSPGAKVASLTVMGSPGGAAAVSLTGTGLAPAALSVVPTTAGFGNVVAGQSSTATQFTVTNTGGVASGALSAVVGGADMSQFEIVSTTCNSALNPGLTCVVNVRFSPTTTGAKTASVAVSGSPGGSAPATLTGTGVPPGALSIAPLSKDFGSSQVGTPGATQVFTVMNTGGAAASAVTATVTGTSANQYAVTADTCAGASLAAAASCAVTVQFNPTAGGTQGASLAVTSASAGNVGASLTGVGLTPAHVVVSPASNGYGSLVAGTTSGDFAFTVQNTGDVATSALTVALAGTDTSQFGITAGGCTGTLAAHGMCTVNVHFGPTTQGAKSASLNVSATTGGASSATLSGTGLAPGALSISVNSHDFGAIEQGLATGSFSFTITNTSGATTGSPTGPLSSSITGAEFTITSDSCNTLPLSNAAGSNTCTVAGRFTAGSTIGLRSGTLSITGNPGGSVGATLTGTSLAHANLTLSPPSAAFGSVLVGATTAPTLFTVGNNGGVTSPTPTVVLADTTHFHLTATANPCSVGVAPGGTCSFGVTFQPSASTSYSSTVTVSGVGINSVPAGLTGTGVTPASLSAPTPVDFGGQFTGVTSMAMVVTVSNVGGTTSGPITLAINGDYAMVAPTGGDCVSGTTMLAPSLTCTVHVTFNPSLFGTRNATLTATSSPGGTATVNLTGCGGASATITCNGKCGTVMNNCGQSINCNGIGGSLTCTATQECAPTHTSCCTPTEPVNCQPYYCGTFTDSCGVARNCGFNNCDVGSPICCQGLNGCNKCEDNLGSCPACP